MKTVLALLFGFAIAGQAQAQTAPSAQHMPRGAAVDVTNAEILSTVQKTAAAPVSDQQIRVLGVNGEYNVGVGVVHRAKTAGRDIGFGIEHSQITEIYHVISGTGTFVTGGTIENMKETPADSPVVARSSIGSLISRPIRSCTWSFGLILTRSCPPVTASSSKQGGEIGTPR